MSDTRDFDRVLWRSRRGMLELDLLLVGFARDRYRALSPALQDAYKELLTLDDWRVWDWLQERTPADRALRGIVAEIVAFNAGQDAP